jgi:hypothetical protein
MAVPAVIPRPIIDADLDYWSTNYDEHPRPMVFVADDPTCSPCPALVTLVPDPHGVIGATVVRVPYQLDEIELAALARGGTLWLSTWGGLPPHMLEVQLP